MHENSIAVIGIAGKFPGSSDLLDFWKKISNGEECIEDINDDELKEIFGGDISGNYVPRSSYLSDVDKFDAKFFGIYPREAMLMDPQHRIFLECCWSAIENAGYDINSYKSRIGVFAGAGFSLYASKLSDILTDDPLSLRLGLDKDYLPIRIAFKLGLTGPSIGIQTACSTSLVSVITASENLLSFNCDMALAGGVALNSFAKEGYFYQKDGIFSVDGKCKPFRSDASGTVFGSGVGVVVLKRMEDAVKDGDNILAVIRGWGINNDGAEKIGFTAPSMSGQIRCIRDALNFSEISPDTIDYIETHGTGTVLGDSIELQALKKVFGGSKKNKFCYLGSVKANVGHCDVASGVVGLIKTILAIKSKIIPPLLHFDSSRAIQGLEDSPFKINSKAVSWKKKVGVRRAGVSSFGMGGTNAHVVLEEYNRIMGEGETGLPPFIFTFSAKSERALEKKLECHRKFLLNQSNISTPGKVAFTLYNGRAHFKYRACIVASTFSECVAEITNRHKLHFISNETCVDKPKIIFVFPGQGSEYISMAKEFYNMMPRFKKYILECSFVLENNFSSKMLINFFESNEEEVKEVLQQSSCVQPLLFCVEYSLAKFLMDFGVCPDVMIGHSLGEYVAAVISGVLTLVDAIKILISRGKLMYSVAAEGMMVSLDMKKKEVEDLISKTNIEVSIAAINANDKIVVSGRKLQVEKFINEVTALRSGSFKYKVINNQYGFHSDLIDHMLAEFRGCLSGVSYGNCDIPYVSSVTGKYISEEDFKDKEYWVNHARNPVLFYNGILTLKSLKNSIYIEIGSGKVLLPLIKRINGNYDNNKFISMLPSPEISCCEKQNLLMLLGRLWTQGVKVDLNVLFDESDKFRVALPTYPFERKTYWYDSGKNDIQSASLLSLRSSIANLSEINSTTESKRDIGQTNEDNTISNQLLGLWRSYFGMKDIKVGDNYFELGGDSLLATQIVSAINQRFNIDIEVKTLFYSPTIKELTDVVVNYGPKEKIAKNKIKSLPRIMCNDICRFKASSAQYRMWFLSELGGNHTMIIHNKIKGKLKIECLKKAFVELIKRHESLRTNFIFEGGCLYQQIKHPHVASKFKVKCVNKKDVGEPFESYVNKLSKEVFVLDKGFLFKVILVFDVKNSNYDLFIMIHHIITDGWSMGIIQRELNQIYNSIYKKQEITLPKMEIQYADFSEWQSEWLLGDQCRKQVEYWINQFDNNIIPEIQPDYPRPVKQTFNGKAIFFEVDPVKAKSIFSLLKKHHASLYIFWLTVLSVLISKYTSSDIVFVGSPTSNRTNNQIESLIGFFVNTLVLKLNLSQNPTFVELIKRVGDVALNAYSNQDVPFDLLIDQLKLRRDLSRTSLFQVRLATHNTPFEKLTFADTSSDFGMINMGYETARYDLELHVFQTENKIILELIYNTDLFSHETASRIIGDLDLTVSQIITDNYLSLDDIQLSLIKNKSIYNHVVNTYQPICIHNLFERSAITHPNRTAVIYDGRCISFSDLNRKADFCAQRLFELGVKAKSVVGICLKPDINLVVSILAILKLGGVYLPIDKEFPVERVGFILSDSGTKFVIVDDNAELFNEFSSDITVISIDNLCKNFKSGCEIVYPRDYSEELKAYLLYTSGSQGKPKGVLISHENLINYIYGLVRTIDFSNIHSLLSLSSFASDFWGTTFWLALSCGKVLHIANDKIKFNGELLRKYFLNNQIDFLKIVPTHYSAILNMVDSIDIFPKKLIMFGGEELDYDLMDKIFAINPACRIINHYGPTECTIGALMHEVNIKELHKVYEPGISIPIGVPLPNVKVYVLNDNLVEVNKGEIGELYISGVGLSSGYLNLPEYTQEVFIKNPFNIDDDRRYQYLYKTGDLVKELVNGNLIFVGRKDSQIKLRGHRIDLQEIQSILQACPIVHKSLLLKHVDKHSQVASIFAYIIKNGNVNISQPKSSKRLIDNKVDEWSMIFDNVYEAEKGRFDLKDDFSGWKSSYTRKEVPRKEMLEWVTNCVERIRLLNPKKILEIGCGTGLLMYRLIDNLEFYEGRDFSDVVINKVKANLKGIAAGKVKLICAKADNFDGIRKNTFDTIVINSVIQKFPGINYLIEVLRGCFKVLKPGGKIFLGDIRNYDLIKEFYISLLILRDKKDLSDISWSEDLKFSMLNERELLVSPKFFVMLKNIFPQIKDFKIQVKAGKFENEMNLFRYDVVLFTQPLCEDSVHLNRYDFCIDFSENINELKKILSQKKHDVLFISNIPNSKVLFYRNILRQSHAINDYGGGISSSVIIDCGEKAGYKVELFCDGDSCNFGALFVTEGHACAFSYADFFVNRKEISDETRSLFEYANNPLLREESIKQEKMIVGYLSDFLPNYMLPSRYIFLDEFPFLPNGKVDIQNLPIPTDVFVQKREVDERLKHQKLTIIEEGLRSIWGLFLNIPEGNIGLHDDFFELGGDSIIAIQVITEASRQGIHINIEDIFKYTKLSDLSKNIKNISDNSNFKDFSNIFGKTLVTPMVVKFFQDNPVYNNHYNQGTLSELNYKVTPEIIKKVFTYLVKHNDGLRLRCVKDKRGFSWKIVKSDAKNLFNFSYFDLSKIQQSDFFDFASKVVNEKNKKINLSNGSIIQIMYYDMGKNKVKYIHILMHHFIIDAVSWRLLFQNMEILIGQALKNRSLKGVRPTCSIKECAKELKTYAKEKININEINYWVNEGKIENLRNQAKFLCVDFLGNVDDFYKLNIVKNIMTVRSEFNEEVTAALQKMLKKKQVSLHEVLLSGLLTSLNRLREKKLQDKGDVVNLVIEMESHGRFDLKHGLDVSNVIGWFTSLYPQTFKMCKKYDVNSFIRQVQEKAANLPNFGVSYGVFKYLGNERNKFIRELQNAIQPLVLFNYVGQVTSVKSEYIKFIDKIHDGMFDNRVKRNNILVFDPMVLNDKLIMNWNYNFKFYNEETINMIADSCMNALMDFLK